MSKKVIIINFELKLFNSLIFTNSFKEVQKHQGVSLSDYARSLALDTLSIRDGLVNVNKLYQKPRIQFLFLHHVFKDEIKAFESLLNELAKHHSFISHSEAVHRILTDTIDKPYISWSSDDGFKNNIEASKILNRFDAKACFFINPDSIGSEDKQWISNFCNKRLNMPPVEFLNWDEVEELQKCGHEIGSHTMNHKSIAKMSLNEIAGDLSKSKKTIEEYCGIVKHFAYPYGHFKDFNKEAFELVFKLGYGSCSTGERGCHVSNGSTIAKQELFIRRDQVICAWKLQHIMYFIANSSRKASHLSNFFPTF